MIVAAAIRLNNGLVLTLPKPARHIDIAIAIRVHCGGLSEEHGFLSDTGHFMSRKVAMDYAQRCGQKLLKAPNERLGLFTEDLW